MLEGITKHLHIGLPVPAGPHAQDGLVANQAELQRAETPF